MKVNEVRVGDYIKSINTDIIITVDLFLFGEISDDVTYLDHLQGIPLTEDWLLKFGFENIDEKLYCKRWRLNRVDIYKMISGSHPFYFRFNQVDLKIKYVHQLQNLYFALTGKELELK